MSQPEESRRVSHETPSPSVLAALFPETKSIQRYVDLLASVGVDRGLIGPREAPRLWSRHVLNCAAVAEVLATQSTVCDIGSGAGLPGVVLALARPDLDVCLVEPLLRRTTFLREVVAELGLTRVEVVRARAEELHGVRQFDAVTSRAVAPLDRLLRWCWPLVAPGGEMLALKGASAADEVRTHRRLLKNLRVQARVEHWGQGITTPPTTLVRIQSRSGSRED